MTRTIIFIRHAEKSKHDVVHLDAQGKARAIFLADYILHPYNDFEVPTAIYTMTAPHSKRCIETMAPTLAKINAVHHINVPRAQSEQLAKTLLMSCEKESSLVCWEHSRIVDIMNNMGIPVTAWGLVPDSHKDEGKCFDATWVLTVTPTMFKLTVYRQFAIKNGIAIWNHPRTNVWWQQSFPRTQEQTRGNICVVS